MLDGDESRRRPASGIALRPCCGAATVVPSGLIHSAADYEAGGRLAPPSFLAPIARAQSACRLRPELPAARRRTSDFSTCCPARRDPVRVLFFQAGQHPRQGPCWITHTTSHARVFAAGSTARRCSPVIKGVVHGTALQSSTKSCASPASTAINYLEPGGLTRRDISERISTSCVRRALALCSR